MAESDAWYRSPDWSQVAQSEFDTRLARARKGNRAQYLRIKALALASAGQRGNARQLLHRLVRDYEADREAVFAHELLGDLYRADRHHREAEEQYRRCLFLCAEQGTRSGTSGLCDLSLAELLIESKRAETYDEADRLLSGEDLLASLRLNNELFRYEVAQARLAAARGLTPVAAQWARRALARAESREPQLPRHPDVGLVDPADPALPELQRLLAVTGY